MAWTRVCWVFSFLVPYKTLIWMECYVSSQWLIDSWIYKFRLWPFNSIILSIQTTEAIQLIVQFTPLLVIHRILYCGEVREGPCWLYPPIWVFSRFWSPSLAGKAVPCTLHSSDFRHQLEQITCVDVLFFLKKFVAGDYQSLI